MNDDTNTTPEAADNDEREKFVQERDESDGTVEESDDSGRQVGRRPGEDFTLPDNDDVEPGNERQPISDRRDGAQDDGSDPVSDDDAEPGDDEPRDKRQ